MFTSSKIITRTIINAAIVCAVFSGSQNAFAQKPVPATGTEKSGDKLDVTDLEKKYWAAKDTDFSVVQNRTYSKAGRLAVFAQYGSLINDEYSEGAVINGGLNYYFSERMGVELSYTSIDSTDNKSTEAFRSTYATVPDHNKIKSFYGASFNWVPFYAKMSVLSSKIIYFDMAISPGVGITQYDAQVIPTGNVSKTAPTATLDVTQMFFLGKHFALRLDYKNRWFNQQVLKSSGVGTAGTEVRKDLNHTSLLTFGAEFFF